MTPGSLTVVGVGPARAAQATLEAVDALREGAARGAVAYGLAHAREIAASIAPDLEVVSLDDLYEDAAPRSDIYRDLASTLLAHAFEEGQDVLYLVAGSPYVANDAVFALRTACDERALPLRIIHGMSFLDLVLDRVFWTGHGGLQLYSAWNVVHDGVNLDPETPALLFQIGEWSLRGEAVRPEGTTSMLSALRARLLERYPANHRVGVLYSSASPEYQSLARAATLDDLAEEPVPVYSNLWIPALGAHDVEAALVTESPPRRSPLPATEAVEGGGGPVRLSEVSDAGIEGRVTLPAGPARPADIVPALRTLADAAALTGARRARATGRRVSCMEGCAACCRLLLLLSGTEARAVVDCIEALTPAHRERVAERFDAARRRLEDAGLAPAIRAVGAADAGSRAALARQYQALGIDCPFLENERCSIYEQRPLVCREHMVTSPAEACAGTDPDRVERVPLGWSASRGLAAWDEGGNTPEPVPLVLVREWVAAHPEPLPARSAEALLREIARAEPGARLSIAEGKTRTRAVHAQELPTPGDRRLIPDYALPDALMVTHAANQPEGVLTHCAVAAAHRVGVLLLSQDPRAAQTFVERQPDPRRFSIVSAELDTPWIRDRAPFAVSTGEGREWVLPKVVGDQRPADATLFANISARPVVHCPRFLSGGNLVAGPQGIAFSTYQALVENDCEKASELSDAAHLLGIRRWIFFAPFREELSGHADVHVRCLAPDLFAVAWSQSREDDRATAAELQSTIEALLPEARCLRIPMRSDGPRYASPVNWVQLDGELLVPRFPMTPREDEEAIRKLLGAHGFRVHFVPSPTEEFGGSLHCLTASIYAAR